MKRIISLIVLIFTYFVGNAQAPTYKNQVQNWRSYNNTNITTATAPHSITPVKVGGGIGDSLAKYLQAMYDTCRILAVSGDNLQAVTDNGNSTTNEIRVQVPSGSAPYIYSLDHYPDKMMWNYISLSGTELGSLSIADLTADRTWSLPDESGSLVTHITDAGITVNVNALYSSKLNIANAGYGARYNITNSDFTKEYCSLGRVTHGGILALKEDEELSDFYVLIKPINLTDYRTQLLPDKDGTFAMLSDIAAVSNLQGVLTAGNTATLGISINSAPSSALIDIHNGGDKTTIDGNKVTLFNASSTGGKKTILKSGITTADKTVTLPIKDGVLELSNSIVISTDANFSVTVYSTCILPDITAGRTITFPISPMDGDKLNFVNNNTTGNTWSLSSIITVKDIGGSTITSLTNGQGYSFVYSISSNTWFRY